MAKSDEYAHPGDAVADAIVAQAKTTKAHIDMIGTYEEPLDMNDIQILEGLAKLNDAAISMLIRMKEAGFVTNNED